MSRIYSDSNIFCPISNHDIHQFHHNEVIHLSKLYFCPQCQLPKSKYQCSFSLQCKFCSNCLNDYSNSIATSCSRNCFACPECSSNVSIAINDHKTGKSFTFTCNFCSYVYNTSIITQPKSLNSILKQEQDENQYENRIFNQFKHALSSTNKSFDEVTTKNLQLSNLLPQQQIDKLQLDESNDPTSSLKFPFPRKLTCKYSIKCLGCNTVLSLPNIEKSPIVNKFAISFSAIDFMPTIKIVKPNHNVDGNRYIFVANFINPLPSPMEISVRTLSVLSVPFVSGTSSGKVTVTIPTSKFVVKPSQLLGSDEIIKQIPTTLLTKNTQTSASELILRLGNKSNLDINQETPENWTDSGNNWYQISINLEIDDTVDAAVKVPLHITVKTAMPETMKKLNLARSDLTFAYWNIIDLGQVKLTST